MCIRDRYIGGAICESSVIPFLVPRRKLWLTPTTRVACNKADKMQNPLKLAGVPQSRQQISAANRSLYCKDMWGILIFNTFFPIVDMSLSCEYIARQICAMVPRWRIFGDFLRPLFSASRVQHVSDLHPKLPLRPHHVWKYGDLSLIHI